LYQLNMNPTIAYPEGPDVRDRTHLQDSGHPGFKSPALRYLSTRS
jgi:hypothetical protein